MSDLFNLDGKHVLITGGAQGLGNMIAQGLLRAGAKVIITSRKLETSQMAAEELRPLGDCIGMEANLSNPVGAAALADQIKALGNPLHVLINNAGKVFGAPIEKFPDEGWPDLMAINVQTPFTLVRELLPLLKASATQDDPARVINLGSLVGHSVQPRPTYSYSSSKAAVHHLTRMLAAHLAPFHITVNAVAPGFFSTRMTQKLPLDEMASEIPLGRLGRAEDVAGACVFLSSRAGAYLTGVILPVDGGMHGCR